MRACYSTPSIAATPFKSPSKSGETAEAAWLTAETIIAMSVPIFDVAVDSSPFEAKLLIFFRSWLSADDWSVRPETSVRAAS
jgi:hypothetical protein